MLKQITIPNPCNEDWNSMHAKEAGRLCAKCETVVVDFSILSDDELIHHIRSGKYHCGRFNEEQLEAVYYIRDEEQKRKKYWSSIAAAIVAGMLQLSTSYAQTPQLTAPRMVSKAIGPKEIKTKQEVPVDKITIKLMNATSNTPISGLNFTLNNGEVLKTDSYGMYELILTDSINQAKKIKFNYQGRKSSRFGYSPRGFKSKTVEFDIEKNINKIVVIKLQLAPRKIRHGGRKWMGKYF